MRKAREYLRMTMKGLLMIAVAALSLSSVKAAEYTYKGEKIAFSSEVLDRGAEVRKSLKEGLVGADKRIEEGMSKDDTLKGVASLPWLRTQFGYAAIVDNLVPQLTAVGWDEYNARLIATVAYFYAIDSDLQGGLDLLSKPAIEVGAHTN